MGRQPETRSANGLGRQQDKTAIRLCCECINLALKLGGGAIGHPNHLDAVHDRCRRDRGGIPASPEYLRVNIGVEDDATLATRGGDVAGSAWMTGQRQALARSAGQTYSSPNATSPSKVLTALGLEKEAAKPSPPTKGGNDDYK